MARKINYVLLVSLIYLFTVSIAGCGLSDMGSHAGDVRLAWSEEVRLPGGEQVVVDRTATGQTDGAIGGPGGWISSEMTLHVPMATPNQMPPPPTWRGAYVPVLLDYDAQQGRWTLIATVSSCPDWYALGRPPAPYLQYETQGGLSWVLVPLEAGYFGRESNLLTGPRHTGEDHLVTLQEKSERKRRSSERFVRIIPIWKTNC
jgi:hypothetical protein